MVTGYILGALLIAAFLSWESDYIRTGKFD
jgi:hypothetical protein